MIIESFSQSPLSTAVKSYLYGQYFDDSDLQAFVDSYNEITQGYVDWFNNTPLALYVSTQISGALLDWIGQGIYGIERPYTSTIKNKLLGSLDSFSINTLAINSFSNIQSGSTQIVTDDIYKRVLTWHLYRGDGYKMSVQWMKRRVARFIYGLNGSDIPIDDIQNISIDLEITPQPIGGLNSFAINTRAINTYIVSITTASHALKISIPNSDIGQIFQLLFYENYLSIPFQVKFTVALI